MADAPGTNREQPELTELNLLVEQYAKETDPERKKALKKQMEQMEGEVEEANSQ